MAAEQELCLRQLPFRERETADSRKEGCAVHIVMAHPSKCFLLRFATFATGDIGN